MPSTSRSTASARLVVGPNWSGAAFFSRRAAGWIVRILLLTPAMLVPAAPADEQLAVWQARPGDEFVLSTLIRRENRISIDDRPPEIRTVIDQLELNYLVQQVMPSGAARIIVTFVAAERSVQVPDGERSESADGERGWELDRDPGRHKTAAVPEASRISQLEGISLTLDVAPDGGVERVSTDDWSGMIRRLAGLNQTTALFMNECWSEETVEAWLSRPFWLTVPAGHLTPGQSWDRTDVISLGILGSTRLSVRLLAPDTLPETWPAFVPLKIHGSGSFVPQLITQKNRDRLPVQLTDLQLDFRDFSGTASFFDHGELSESEEPDSEEPRRPPFDQMTFRFGIHGSCHVKSAGQTHVVRFEQLHSQNWMLTSWPSTLSLPNMFPGHLIDAPARVP